MAGAVIGALRGVLGLDTAAFERGAKRSKATMGDVERSLDRLALRAERVGRRFAIGVTAPLAAMATVAVKSSLQTVDAQAKMAQSFGTTVKSLQVLERAGDLAGVSMGEVQQASIQLTKRLSQAASGGGAAAKVLERLHLRAQDLQKLPLDERLAKIQGAMAKFIPEAEQAAVASDLFGSRAGLIFTRIDTATLATATRDVERFGVAVSEVDAEQIEVTNDALSRLGLVSKGLANQLTASLAAPLEVIANKAADAAAWFTGLSDETKRVIAVSATLAAGLGPIALGLGAIIKLSAPVVTGLVAIAGAAKALSVAVIAATGPWGLLAGAAVAAAGYLLLFRDNSGKVETAAYDAAAGTAALSGELAEFTRSYAPQAAKSAINLANDNYKLAASAFEAAKAEVAKRKAIAEAALIEYDAAADPEAALILGSKSDSAYLALAKAVEKYRKQEIVLQQTLAERKRVETVVTGSDTKMAESLKKISTELGISVKGLDQFSGGAKGAGKSLDDLVPKIGAASDVIENRLMTGIDGAAGAFGDLVANGFEDFEDFTDGLKATFRNALRDMATTAARNKITVWLGLGSTGGVAGTAAASVATGGGGAGGGLLGGLLGNAGGSLLGGGGLLGGIGTGLGGVLSGGGLGSSFANLGGLLSGSVGGAGAIGAAIPAVGMIVAAAAVLSKALSRKYAGTAIRGTLGADGFDGTSFDFYKGGALRSNKANYKPVPDAIQAMLDTTMRGVTTGLTGMATALGLSTGALAGFNDEQFTLWTNGKDQAQIQQELGVFIESASDQMAALVLGTDAFNRAGESAHDALTRLSTGLSAANDQADLLGHRLFAVSLGGADLASRLVDAFGGVEAMTAATQSYWQAVYSEAERNEITLRRLRATFADLNLVMPESRAQLRGLVEGFDTTTDAGQKLYAQVMGLSGALDQVLPQVAEFTLSMDGLLTNISGEIGTQLDLARGMASDAKAASSLWYRTATTLRDFLADLLNSGLSAASRPQTAAANRARFEQAYALARGGDVEAARSIPELAKAYLGSAQGEASSALEYRRIAGLVQGQVQFLSGLSELEGANKDVLQTLYEEQIEVLTGLGSFLQLEGLTNDQLGKLDASIQGMAADWDGTLDGFQSSLGSLQSAIEATEAFSYDALRERLNIAVDILPSADVPPYLAQLIAKAQTGLSANIDFVVRASDLTPDLRWLALQSASEHVKTLEFAVGQDLAPDVKALALERASSLGKTVNLIAGGNIPMYYRQIALAGNSELSRTINATLASGIDPQALRLALDAVGAYDVSVRAALDAGISADVRKIVFADAGSYAAAVRASLAPDMPAGIRRALLDQQGDLAVNVTGILAAETSDWMRALLLNANTSALRGVTIAATYADALEAADLELLREASTHALRTIQAQVNPAGITASGLVFLDQLTRRAPVKRAIDGTVYTRGIGWTDGALLDQLQAGAGSVSRAIAGRVHGDARSWTARALLRQLDSGDGSTTRDLRGSVFGSAKSWTARALLDQLASGAGSITRNLRGSVFGSAKSWTGIALLTQLQAGSGAIRRVIDGEVNVSNLSAEQRALLKSITGATAGTLTLGGSFSFDPSSGFSTWFGSTVSDGIAAPMATLTGALGELRAAVAGQTATMKRQETLSALDAYARGLMKNEAGQYVATQAQVRELAQIAGVNMNGTAHNLAWRVKTFSDADLLHDIDVDPTGYQTRQLLQARIGTDGLRVDPEAYLKAYGDVASAGMNAQAHFDRHGRKEILSGARRFNPYAFDWGSIGLNIPGFATGGAHTGGWRVVGERGWELEHTGPSRVISNSEAKSMLDQSQVVEGLRQIERRLERIEKQERQLGMQQLTHQKNTAKTLRKWDLAGQPVERAE